MTTVTLPGRMFRAPHSYNRKVNGQETGEVRYVGDVIVDGYPTTAFFDNDPLQGLDAVASKLPDPSGVEVLVVCEVAKRGDNLSLDVSRLALPEAASKPKAV